MTRLRSLLAAAVLLGLCTVARAQVVTVYATLSVPHISNVQTGSVYNGSTFVEQYTALTPASIGGGVTFNFLPLPVVKLGFDLRGSTKSGNNGVDTALGGLKLTLKPPVLRIKPYIQGSVGYLDTRTTNVSTVSTGGSSSSAIGGTFENKYAIYQGIVGVDYPLLPFIDVRIGEIGLGHSFLDGSTPGVSVFTFNTGLTVHF